MGKMAIIEKVENDSRLKALKNVDPIEFLNNEDLVKSLVYFENEVTAEIHDAQTEGGRKNIKALGAKIRKSLSFVEKAALDHARILKAEPGKFDAKRKIFKDFMNELNTKTIQPLVDFEAKEKDRTDGILRRINAMNMSEPELANLNTLLSFHMEITLINIDESFQEYVEFAAKTKNDSMLKLEGFIARKKEEQRLALEAEQIQQAKEETERLAHDEQIRTETRAEVVSEMTQKIPVTSSISRGPSGLSMSKKQTAYKNIISDLTQETGLSVIVIKDLIKSIAENKIRHISLNY